jgi:hypothetical protein
MSTHKMLALKMSKNTCQSSFRSKINPDHIKCRKFDDVVMKRIGTLKERYSNEEEYLSLAPTELPTTPFFQSDFTNY